jgi:hypothetical protein
MPIQGAPAGGGTRRGRGGSEEPANPQRSQGPRTDDDIISAFINGEGIPARVKDAWKRV